MPSKLAMLTRVLYAFLIISLTVGAALKWAVS